jgi:hypothetical protein
MYTLEDGSQVNNLPYNYTGSWKVASGNKFWYHHGKRHRIDGPAIEWVNGIKEWYQDGKLHRLDGPAYEGDSDSNGWYQYGKLHRLDGPAREWDDGTKEWWINSNQITKQTRIVCIR